MSAGGLKPNNKKIKNAVIIIEDSSKTVFGGGQRVSTIAAEILAESVYLIACDHVPDSIFLKKVEHIADEVHSLSPTEYDEIESKNIVKKTVKHLEIVLTLGRIVKIAQTESVNVVLYPTTKKGLLYSVAFRFLFGVRVVFHVHFMPIRWSLRDAVMQFILCLTDLNICVSDAVAKMVLPKNKIVINNPILTSKNKSANKSKASIFGAVGTLIPEKGFQYLVTASKMIAKRDAVSIYIYGEGPLLEGFQYESRLGRIKCFGFVDDMDSQFDKVIDVLILPSIIQEAAPMVIVEAFSHGVPVITTSIGGQATMVQHEVNGLIVPPKSAIAIAKAINRISNDRELYKKLSKNALISAKKYDKKFFARNLLANIIHASKNNQLANE